MKFSGVVQDVGKAKPSNQAMYTPSNTGYDGNLSYVKDEWGDNGVSKVQDCLIEVGNEDNEDFNVANDTNDLLYHDLKLHSVNLSTKYGHMNGIGKRDGKSSVSALVID